MAINEQQLQTFIKPDWPAPETISSVITTRRHPGASTAAFAHFNLATHVGDMPGAVAANRAQLATRFAIELPWLNQIHSSAIVCLEKQQKPNVDCDGSYTQQTGIACVVLTADCMPVFLCDSQGQQVMCLHAGWRGLASGILSRGVSLFPESSSLLAYLGPAISAENFEVGEEVKSAFLQAEKDRPYSQPVESAFYASNQKAKKYYADLYQLARFELTGAGVSAIFGGDYCTFKRSDLFYSYRREGTTGRFASLIWRNEMSRASLA